MLDKKKKAWILGAGVAFIIVIATIVLSLTLNGSNETRKPDKFIREEERLDCMPKARFYPSSKDEDMCLKKNCLYDSSKTTSNAPKCFYDILNMKFRHLGFENTKLGEIHHIESTFGKKVRLQVTFEFLNNDVFRFKVNNCLIF